MTAVHELSARELAAAIRGGELSAREALEVHLGRLDAVNPAINAVVTVAREQAYARAARADELAASGAELPPLHGVPLTHKDTHATAGIRTTHGSPLFRDAVPAEDDLVVARLRAAGAVSTGKSNVPEFAAGSHTFNELFGATRNPYDLSRSAGGSSGGAAAAVAARIQALSDGSDMGGSLRNPASFCNVVGFRPSLGVVPVAPTANAWAWLSRTGPIARDVGDVALAMSVLAGPDPRVPYPCPVDGAAFAALAAEDDGTWTSAPLAGVRVAVSENLGVPVEVAVRERVRAAAEVLVGLGADVREGAPDLADADEVFDVTRAFDMALSLGDVVAAHPEEVKPEVRWNVERGWALTGRQLMSAARARTRLRGAVAEFFAGTDVLLCPTSQVLPFDVAARYPTTVAGVEMRTYVEWMRSATLISATGCPAVSVPGGFSDDGLPVGVQLVAAHGRDVPLLRAARAFEQATGYARRTPDLAVAR